MVDAKLPRCPRCNMQTERVETHGREVAWCRWCRKLVAEMDDNTEVEMAKQKPKKPAQKPAEKPRPKPGPGKKPNTNK